MKKLLLLSLLFVACSSEEDESNDSDWVPKVDITLDYSILQGGSRPDGQPLRPYFPDFGKDENGLNIVILKDVDCFTSLKVRMDSNNGFTFARRKFYNLHKIYQVVIFQIMKFQIMEIWKINKGIYYVDQ